MPCLLTLGPLGAQARLGGPAVRAGSPVQGTENPAFLEISTCRNHLDSERVGRLPADLTEVRALPGPYQVFQMLVPFGTENLDLKVPAAGGAHGVVGGLAPGGQAGRFGYTEDGQLPLGWWRALQRQRRGASVLNDDETVITQLPVLLDPARLGQGCPVSVGAAANLAVVDLRVPARDIQPNPSPQFGAEPEQRPEPDPLGMAVEPGGLGVHGTSGPGVVIIGNPERNRQAEAVGAGTFTLGNEWHGA